MDPFLSFKQRSQRRSYFRLPKCLKQFEKNYQGHGQRQNKSNCFYLLFTNLSPVATLPRGHKLIKNGQTSADLGSASPLFGLKWSYFHTSYHFPWEQEVIDLLPQSESPQSIATRQLCTFAWRAGYLAEKQNVSVTEECVEHAPSCTLGPQRDDTPTLVRDICASCLLHSVRCEF